MNSPPPPAYLCSVSPLQPKCALLHQREDAPRSPTAAVSPSTTSSSFLSTRRHRRPCPRLAMQLAYPVYQWKPVSRPSGTAIRYGNVRFVFSRDAHAGVAPRANGGLDIVDGDGAIACPRRQHPNVSGNTICPRHDSVLGVEGVVKPSRSSRLPWIAL